MKKTVLIATVFIAAAVYKDGKYLRLAKDKCVEKGTEVWRKYVDTIRERPTDRHVAKAAPPPADGFTFACEASWYSREECCTAKNPDATMANGEPLDDSAFTCANWDYPFGTKLLVTSGASSVEVIVTDRGPAKRLYWQGRMIDLSQAAFRCLAPLDAGVVDVEVTEL